MHLILDDANALFVGRRNVPLRIEMIPLEPKAENSFASLSQSPRDVIPNCPDIIPHPSLTNWVVSRHASVDGINSMLGQPCEVRPSISVRGIELNNGGPDIALLELREGNKLPLVR
jgi:hypothetical protein